MGMRISGLASGMDIDQLVGNLMKANRKPLDKLHQTKQTIEWQRDGYREMNNLLKEFDKFIFEGVYRESNIKPKKVASTDETKVSASASASAGSVSYSIDKVDQLATAATKSSAASIAKNASFDPNKSIYDMRANFNGGDANFINGAWDTFTSETITAKENGTKFSLANKDISTVDSAKITVYDAKGTKLKDFTTEVTNPANLDANSFYVDKATGEIQFGETVAAGSKFDITYTNYQNDTINVSTAGKDFKLNKRAIDSVKSVTVTNEDGTETKTMNVTTNATPAAGEVYINQETGEMKFGDQIDAKSKIEAKYVTKKQNFSMTTYNAAGDQVKRSFNFEGDQTLNQVLNQIRNSDVGVNAFYDDFSKKVSFTRKDTGDFNTNGEEIQLEGDFLNKSLGFDPDGNGSKETGGANAKFTINGMDTERNSNSFELNGISFTLKSTFTSPVTVTTTNDSDKAFDTIVQFVNKYNETIDKINGTLTEKRYRDYPPLTDDQRKDMKDGDIKLWDEKAKSGMLRNDTVLSSGLNKMREQLYRPVSGTSGQYTQISQIGITTTKNFLDRGKLEIDETKLKKALTDNPDDVYKLLMSDGATTSEKGIARRMRDTIKETMVKIEDKAGNTLKTNQQFVLGRDLDDIDKRMATMDDRLKQMEDRYYRQFTAMEQAIQRANAQSSQFLQQLGSGK